jgi:hypothetical protein
LPWTLFPPAPSGSAPTRSSPAATTTSWSGERSSSAHSSAQAGWRVGTVFNKSSPQGVSFDTWELFFSSNSFVNIFANKIDDVHSKHSNLLNTIMPWRRGLVVLSQPAATEETGAVGSDIAGVCYFFRAQLFVHDVDLWVLQHVRCDVALPVPEQVRRHLPGGVRQALRRDQAPILPNTICPSFRIFVRFSYKFVRFSYKFVKNVLQIYEKLPPQYFYEYIFVSPSNFPYFTIRNSFKNWLKFFAKKHVLTLTGILILNNKNVKMCMLQIVVITNYVTFGSIGRCPFH